MDFILIPNDGDDTILPCDTAEEITAAQIALRDAGIDSAPVWRGEAPDAIKTSMVVVAADGARGCPDITIEPVGTRALYLRYDGQHAPQGCYVELDTRTGELCARANAEIGNGIPFDVHHGLVLRWRIPALVDHVADDLLAQIAPLAQRIYDGTEEVHDGRNWVAKSTDDAADAEALVAAMCAKNWDEDDQIKEWEAEEWYAAGRASTRTELGIDGATTDDRLAEIEAEEEAQMYPSVIHGLRKYLRALRDEAQEIDAA